MSAATVTVHASCIAVDGRGILLSGRSGSGKSDLALRLIDRGASLVSDDYTILNADGDRLFASAPANIAGMIEVRGLGIVERPCVETAAICLFVDLDGPVDRMPGEGAMVTLAGIDIPAATLNALEASAPIKVEVALDLLGLTR